MKTRPFLILLLAAVLFACKKEKPPTPAPAEEEPDKPAVAITRLDQSYGSDARQKFDIYLPANRTAEATPVLFLIHGGAWMAGDKKDLNEAMEGLRNMFPDYAFVNMGYRLYANGRNKFPTQELDVKACIEYVLQRHKNYTISQKFGVVGFSAGAHLALLYAYKHGPASFHPKVVVDFFGPTDFISLHEQASTTIRPVITQLAGQRFTDDSLVYISSSPLRYTGAHCPPTLILQGAADTVVPYLQSEALNTRLKELGTVREYHLYPNEGHSFSQLVSLDALVRVHGFLNTHLKK
jgi:acetyl esterase/lipase